MRASFLLSLLLAGTASVGIAAENWPGLEGMGARHNASAVDLDLANVEVAWTRAFHGERFGNWQEPINERKLPGAKGSRNLTLVDGKLALIGRDEVFDFEASGSASGDWHLVVLDAASGETLNNILVFGNCGNQRVYHWPEGTVSQGSDNVTGFINTWWDPDTGILFLANSGYDAAYSAYLPMANADQFTGTPQPGIPAYQTHLAHEGFADSFGRKRGEQETRQGTALQEKTLLPWAWGPAGLFTGGKDKSHCLDYTEGLDRGNPSYYNLSGLILGGPGGLVGISVSDEWGHTCAGWTFWYHAATGMKALAGPMPDDAANGAPLSPFKHEGGIVVGDRVFAAGPGHDVNDDGELGHHRKSIAEGLGPLDQGLAVWSYRVGWEDRQPNDGYEGPGAAETALFELEWAHRLPSDGEWDSKSPIEGAESWIEQDGFHRNKALLADGEQAWFAWKPSAASNISLVRFDATGVESFDLGVGAGLHGVDIWPHMSLTTVDGRKLIVYMNGVGRHRTRYIPELADTARIHDKEELKKPEAQRKLWEDLSDEERQKVHQSNQRRGFWSDELQPPRGSASLVIFDVEAEAVLAWHDLATLAPSLPVMGFWTFLDRCQMVVAGDTALVGWVDPAAEAPTLKLLAFDLTQPEAAPIGRAFPLEVEGKGTILHDLIAADGSLYALVTESEQLWIRDPRWTRQLVLALR